MRKAILILLVLAVLAAAGVWAYRQFFAAGSQPAEVREEARVERGSLLAMVNATGTILPEKQTILSFRGAGRVAEVWVVEGQQVRAGERLARLDSAELEFAVKGAELALAAAQAQLARVQRPPAEADLVAARAALASAQAVRERLLAGPSPEEIKVARTSVDQAKAVLDQAQAAYNLVANRPEVAMLPQALQLQQATIAYEAAKASFELTLRKPSKAEMAAAQATIAQAEATLARLQAGLADEDLLAAQLQVEQAQLALDQARHQLDSAELTASHDGTITLVSVKAGELTAGQPAVILSDLSHYRVDIPVDEIDIGRVAVSQPVTITLDALPGETLRGQVERIAEAAQLDVGVVTYKVTISLDPSQAPLRSGMTANVDIVTDRRDGILLVPNRFVRIDRATGKTYVDRASGVAQSQVQSIEIQIGLRDETHSEVLAGLSEGETVVLIKQSSREQLRQTFQMGGTQ